MYASHKTNGAWKCIMEKQLTFQYRSSLIGKGKKLIRVDVLFTKVQMFNDPRRNAKEREMFKNYAVEALSW
jgi:hypothetical protein